VIAKTTNAVANENKITVPVLAVDRPSNPASDLRIGNMITLNRTYAANSANAADKQPSAIFG